LGAVVKGRPVIGDALGDLLGEADRRVEAGADGGAALRQFHQARQRQLDALDAVLDLRGIAGELLAERQRGRVLGVGAADLDDVGEGLRPWRPAPCAGASAPAAGRARSRSAQAMCMAVGIGVVRRLAHVDVVVGMDRLLEPIAAEHLDGAVGDHLVGVHVGLGARAGLPDDEREMIVELAVDHLLRGLDDGLADLRVEPPSAMLASAAARLTMPSARTTDSGCFSQPILKLPSERCACAPQ
jgi:hypothetical protein